MWVFPNLEINVMSGLFYVLFWIMFKTYCNLIMIYLDGLVYFVEDDP